MKDKLLFIIVGLFLALYVFSTTIEPVRQKFVRKKDIYFCRGYIKALEDFKGKVPRLCGNRDLIEINPRLENEIQKMIYEKDKEKDKLESEL